VAVVEPLEALVEAEILRRRRDDDRVTYEFRHALLQRVAYESMIQADRRAMHARIADLLEQRSNSMPAIPEVMAHHLTQAERSHEAITAWLAAAAAASRRSALVEAIAHIRNGLSLLEGIREPEVRRQLELSLQAALIGPLTSTRGVISDELSQCCERGMELSLVGEPTPLVLSFMFGQFTFLFARGRTSEAISLAENFLSQATRMSHDSARVVGHRLAGMAYQHRGELMTAKGHFERSLELYSAERDDAATHMFGQNTQVHSRCLLGLTHFLLGDVDEALHTALDTLRSAEELEHAHSTALALSYGGLIVGLCGAPEALMNAARRLTAISEQHRLGPFLTVGKAFLGWALCQRGDLEQGIAVMEEAIAAADAAQNRLGMARYLATLADARRRNGQLNEARLACVRAREMLALDSKWFEPEVLRVEALVARDLDPQETKEAEAGLQRAIESARRSGLPVFELRCLLELRSLLGPARQTPAIDSRIEQLAHVHDVGRRAEAAVRARAPSLYPDVG